MKIVDFEYASEEMVQMMLIDLASIYDDLRISEYMSIAKEKIKDEVSRFINNRKISGAVCYENETMVGFLFAELRDEEKKQAWVPSFGIVAKGNDEDQIIYELYRYCSKKWINQGYIDHVIESLNMDRQIRSLQMLGFAYQQVHGLLKIDDYLEIPTDTNISVRYLKDNDTGTLREMADVIHSYQSAAPIYGVISSEHIQKIREGFVDLINDEEVIFYIAENDRPLAFQGLWDIESGYLIPPKCLELVVAGTFSEVSHKGVGSALMNYVMNDLKKKGYEWIETDWRMTNISSRRFWHDKCGFKVTKHRMIRKIDGLLE